MYTFERLKALNFGLSDVTVDQIIDLVDFDFGLAKRAQAQKTHDQELRQVDYGVEQRGQA